MTESALKLDTNFLEVLRDQDKPLAIAARELIVLGLYRRGEISRGKAAELMDMRLGDFLDRASDLGIPYLDYTEEEWADELRSVEEVVRERRPSPIPVR